MVTEAETDTGGVLETLAPAAPAAVSVQPARRGRWFVAGLGFCCYLPVWRLPGRLGIALPRILKTRRIPCGRSSSTRATRHSLCRPTMESS